MEKVTIIVGDDVFFEPKHIVDYSEKFKELLQEDTIILKDENPELMKQLFLHLNYEDYVYPKKLQDQMKQLEEKYKIKEFFFFKPNTTITKKAQLYIDEAKGDINEAFRLAMSEDYRTLRSIYNQGVDLNYDVGKCSGPFVGLNMFNWSITAHGVCSPEFLEYFFRFERKDIKEYQQKLFEFACSYATPKHIDIFMKYVGRDNLDIFDGVYYAILNSNLTNLHHLILFYDPTKLKENEKKLMGLVDDPTICSYLVTQFGFQVSQEILLKTLENKFYETFKGILGHYLKSGGKPFELNSEMIKEALTTSDRFSKLELLLESGFTGIKIDELKKLEKEGILKEPSIKRYYSRAW